MVHDDGPIVFLTVNKQRNLYPSAMWKSSGHVSRRRWRNASWVSLLLLLIAMMDSHQVMAFAPLPPSSTYSSRLPPRQSIFQMEENILDRFTDPKIEDPRLPLTEAGIAQIVAPTLELFWLRINQSPFPSWAAPLYDYTFTPRGALLAPTLVHGAGLACCWLLGCLAAKGKVFTIRIYVQVLQLLWVDIPYRFAVTMSI
jgi:hypothetical protein